MKSYMYILECSNGAYYTGSTKDINLRIQQHQNGEGANFTKKHLPVKLVYYEEFQKIADAFDRGKQVQGWSRKKKEALIKGNVDKLPGMAECKNDSHSKNAPFGSAQGPPSISAQGPPSIAVQEPPSDSNRSLSGVETPGETEVKSNAEKRNCKSEMSSKEDKRK